MKIPFNWLKEYVDVGTMKAEDVAEKLTIAGLEVVMIEKVSGDSIFDIEVTPNRPDCLSLLGIGREVSASLRKRFKAPGIRAPKAGLKEKPAIEIKDKALCPRYTARIIRHVKIGPSPKWLAEKIEAMGSRPVNNVVDITNYCLFETGQPTHAFDNDKLKGKITIRRARKGEKIVTIDGKERALDAETLVIADEEKPVALAGVMGSKDTEVTGRTKNILFESAYFNPVSIRRTSRSLGLISESSYRFERSVDMGGVASASNRACSLIIDICGGKAGPLADAGEKDPKDVKIYLRPKKLQGLLGIEISVPDIKRALSSLGLKIETLGKDEIVVSVPSFRRDLKAEVDLIEEIVRIYGYDRLKSTMPTIVGHPKRIERPRELIDAARDALVSLGADEIITYSLISREDILSLGGIDEDSVIAIKNPLSIEQEFMRPTLIPGNLHAVAWNINRGTRSFRIFELGRVYKKDKNNLREEEGLSIFFSGDKSGSEGSRGGVSFFNMKGALEALFEKLGAEEVLFKNEDFPRFLTGEAASLEISGEKVGFLGKVAEDALDRFGIKTDVVLCELSLTKLLKYVRLDRRFKELPRFPSAKRDISVIVRREIPYYDIVSAMKAAGGDLVVGVELFDQYSGPQIPAGEKSLSYSIEYRAYDRTLTDDEVNGLHAKVCDALIQRLSARIR